MKAEQVTSVLLCTDYLPPSGGGVEVVVEEMACLLTERGIDVTIVTLESAQEPTLKNESGVTVYTLPTYDLTSLLGLQSQLAPSAITKFRAIIRDIKPDVVHAHNRFFLPRSAPPCGVRLTYVTRL